VLYEMPEPGSPIVVRVPLLPKFVVRPRRPTDTLNPRLAMFSRSPGSSLNDLRKRNPIVAPNRSLNARKKYRFVQLSCS